jgi:hypothetical protein
MSDFADRCLCNCLRTARIFYWPSSLRASDASGPLGTVPVMPDIRLCQSPFSAHARAQRSTLQPLFTRGLL